MDEISHELGLLRGRLESVESGQTKLMESVSRIEERLRKQELKQHGISAVFGALAAVAVNLLGGGTGGPQA